MAKDYVDNFEGAYRVADSRVSLDSIVYCFREGVRRKALPTAFPH